MEEREGRGEFCKRFPDGTKIASVPLEPDEMVFGIYRDKYIFTPSAFIMLTPKGTERVPWNRIAHCSTRHGDSAKTSKLTLTDGTVIKVPIGEFATVHSGRISQLFHQMIERWGAPGGTGLPHYTIEQFFAAADSEYCLGPNVEPHPSLDQLRAILTALRSDPDVTCVMLRLCELEDNVPIADGVLIATSAPADRFQSYVESLHAEGIIEPDANDSHKMPPHQAAHVWMIVFD